MVDIPQDSVLTNYMTAVEISSANERVSGYPKPELYNHHYINKYSFPKGLVAMSKPEHLKKLNERISLYDMDQPSLRKGIAGWKLTKRSVVPTLYAEPPMKKHLSIEQSRRSKTKQNSRSKTEKLFAKNNSYIEEPHQDDTNNRASVMQREGGRQTIQLANIDYNMANISVNLN